MYYVLHPPLDFIFTSIFPVGLFSQVLKSIYIGDDTYLWYSDHTADPAKEKKTNYLAEWISLTSSLQGNTNLMPGRGQGKEKKKKKDVALVVPELQQSRLGSNEQILWTTLNCSFSK